ncbi:MAG TPA: branched-chain amino acid ABC transporter permease [Rhodocyclaceae bacterium]|nr:branched-chain amino acid ABC transporter permease [Rhodocyclaceae bacterium]
MTWILILEQCLNSLQFGLMLFLLVAGLTLIFGIMDLINLAHGSLYMIGAYLVATFAKASDSFLLAVLLGLAATAVIGMVIEALVLRGLYKRDHLSQVLATFGLILIANETTRAIWGVQPLSLNVPQALSGSVELLPGLHYSAFRLAIIVVGLAVAALLYFVVVRTRVGMLVRAGASNRKMATAMGTNIKWLFTAVFGAGAALCALAGAMLGPLLVVQVGMGENILILAFVTVVIGGIGSMRGAFIGALLVGVVDTFGRAFVPTLLRTGLSPSLADAAGPSLAAIAIYLLMVIVLFWKPQGLFPAGS